MTAKVTLDGDQLIATRYLDAASALVWEVFTTPENLAAFWGWRPRHRSAGLGGRRPPGRRDIRVRDRRRRRQQPPAVLPVRDRGRADAPGAC